MWWARTLLVSSLKTRMASSPQAVAIRPVKYVFRNISDPCGFVTWIFNWLVHFDEFFWIGCWDKLVSASVSAECTDCAYEAHDDFNNLCINFFPSILLKMCILCQQAQRIQSIKKILQNAWVKLKSTWPIQLR